MKVLCIRTRMIGGGTSYDVLIPCSDKSYYPITGCIYATKVVWKGKEFFRIADWLRSPEIDQLDISDNRLETFSHLHKVASGLAIRIASRAFTELLGRRKLPTLWADWTLPSKEVWVDVNLTDGKTIKCKSTTSCRN